MAAPRWLTRTNAKAFVIILLLWTGLALLSLAQTALTAPPGGPPAPFGRLLIVRLLDWYTCALFIPAFIWLSRRLPLTDRRWLLPLSTLFAASAMFVVLKYLIFVPITRALTHRADMTFARVLGANAMIELIIFWAVIAVIQAYEAMRRLREQEHHQSVLQAQLVESQLNALSAQLQPHFLFNALHAVSTLMHRDIDGADRMITKLGDLLRATLSRTHSHEITLDDELALADRYLDIMRVRFSDRLTIVINVEEPARRALVPQLLLQPLIENALDHGISRRPGAAELRIAAARSNDQICISIADDGVGLAASQATTTGVGLANTRARLEQLYGDRQSLRLTTMSPGGGVIVEVCLPWHIA